MSSVNYTDAAVVIIIALCVLNSRSKGITYFMVSTIGKIIAVILSVTLNGTVSRFLRSTPVFPFVKERINTFADAEALPYVSGFTEHLMANDNSEIYELFQVADFTDYVSSYIANIAMNILASVVIYFCVSFILTALFRANHVFSGLPLIKQINTVTGLLAGFIEGVIIIWLLIIALIFFVLQGKLVNVYEMLLVSKIAIYFLRYNIFAAVIFSVVA